MPRSSRGCSFCQCEEKSVALCRTEDGRSRRFAEKNGHPGRDHAAVPRTLRGATNGASGGDSPMSELSPHRRRWIRHSLTVGGRAGQVDIRARRRCGCRAQRLDGGSVRCLEDRVQGRTVHMRASEAGVRRHHSAHHDNHAATSAVPFHRWPVSGTVQRGRGVLGGGVERLW